MLFVQNTKKWEKSKIDQNTKMCSNKNQRVRQSSKIHKLLLQNTKTLLTLMINKIKDDSKNG